MTTRPCRSHALAIFLLTACALSAACAPDDPSANADPSPQMDMGRPTDQGPMTEEDISFPPIDLGMPAQDQDRPDVGDPPVDMGPDQQVDPVDMPAPVDMDMPPTGAYPKAAQVVMSGPKDKILLKGAVLTLNGVIDPGEVLVVGDMIACAEASCAAHPEASQATVVQTHGIISPGLIDAHNHLPYNFLPEWVPPAGAAYTNRYQWADEPSYEEHVLPYTAHRSSNSHFCPAARWGELRSLLHGTTTMQGQSFARTCTKGGVRNADQDHELDFYDHMRTTIGSVRDINDSAAQGYIDSFRDPTDPVTRFAVHMAEGYSGDNVTEEFSSFAGRDTRNNRHMGVSLLEDGTAVLIHAIGVTDAELQEAKQKKARIVWSPSSNMVLYGKTADIDRILELGIPTGIGPDWTLSGEDDMLGELRYARQWALDNGAMRVTPRTLWEMATAQGADAVGLDAFIGELAPGQVADITVFRRRNAPADLYDQAITSRAEDVRLVLIGGQAYSGDAALQAALARRADCEGFDVCGQQKFVCAKYDGDDTFSKLADIEGALTDILEGTGFPAEEQYGRGDELLPLVQCK